MFLSLDSVCWWCIVCKISLMDLWVLWVSTSCIQVFHVTWILLSISLFTSHSSKVITKPKWGVCFERRCTINTIYKWSMLSHHYKTPKTDIHSLLLVDLKLSTADVTFDLHVIAVWVVAPFCSNPEDSMEFGSMKHAQRIVSTFTQLFLMCYYVILVKNPRLATMDITETVERSLVSEFIKCYSFSTLLFYVMSTFIRIYSINPFIRHVHLKFQFHWCLFFQIQNLILISSSQHRVLPY